MNAKGVAVFDPSGVPIANAIAIMNGFFSPLTNAPDGYALFNVGFAAGPTYIVIIANGFKSYIQPVNLDNIDQNIIIGKQSQNPNDIVLPPLSFSKPSRDSIINVQANFCNLRDADDIPIFTIFLSSLLANGNISKADDWVQRLKAAKSTHIDIGLTAIYNENLGWISEYPIPSIDLTNSLGTVTSILNHIIDVYGMIPHLHLPWDDNGFEWGVKNIPGILNTLSEFTDKILWNTGWDGCFPTWTRDQLIQAIDLMRGVLGSSAQLATEFAGPAGSNLPYIDMGQGQADYDGPLQELDCLCLEYGTGQFDNKCGMQQQLSRLFGPSYPFSPIPGCDDHFGEYYLAAPRPRGKLNISAFEWVWGGAFEQIRKNNIPADAITIANQFKSYGFTSFGNGQPL